MRETRCVVNIPNTKPVTFLASSKNIVQERMHNKSTTTKV